MITFDYQVCHTCEYPIPCRSELSGEVDCGKPAPYLVWWDYDDVEEDPESRVGEVVNWHEEMYVCEEHFQEIQRQEDME